MSKVEAALIVLIPLAPWLACLATAANIPTRSKGHWPTLFGCGFSLASAFVLTLLFVGSKGTPDASLEVYRWVEVTGELPLNVAVSLKVDELSAVMLLAVTFVTMLIVVHAAQTLHDDPACYRFFAAVSLQLFAMLLLLLSTNFLMVLLCWQLAALGGDLLNGIRSELTASAAAARKAFLVGRAADLFFIIGIFLIWTTFGSLDFSEVLGDSGKLAQLLGENQPADVLRRNRATLNVICFCLFAGAAGRCSQFPLFGWLNEAAGERASICALVQAATIMPAGVYLIARCTPLFEAAADARLLMAFVGGFTALLTAATAVTNTSLKRVLSDSTASHYGLMFLGLGTGHWLGITGAMLLLVTHMLVKTALFLATGNVASRGNGNTEFSELGGLRRTLPFAYWSFLVGLLVLASGFWGQNLVLLATGDAAHHPAIVSAAEDEAVQAVSKPFIRMGWLGMSEANPQLSTIRGLPSVDPSHSASVLKLPGVGPFGAEPGNLYSVLLWLAMFSRLLTSFALFRAFFLTFHNNSRDGSPSTRRAEWNAAETSAALRWPLLLSSGAAVVIGLAVAGSANWFDRFLSRALTVKAVSADVDPFLIGFSGLLGLLGIVVAWMMYSQSSTWPQRIFDALGPFSRLSRHRFYLEDCCLWCVILPIRGLAQLCRFFDRFVVDGLLASLPERIPARLSKAAKSLQNEHVQFYATSLVLAAAVLLVVLLWLEG